MVAAYWVPIPPPEVSLPYPLSQHHPLPQGTSSSPRMALQGIQSIPSLLPPVGGLPSTALTGHPQVPYRPYGIVVGPPFRVLVTRGKLGHHLPIQGQCLGAGGVSAPHNT